MWKRILWDIVAIILVFWAPWWVTFIVGIGGVVLFPWYLEIIFLGAFYDAIFGGNFVHWYHHLIHTAIFTIPLLIGELIKTNINW